MTDKKFKEVLDCIDNYNSKVQFVFTQEKVDALRKELKESLEKVLTW